MAGPPEKNFALTPVLERNLRALAIADPALAQRVCLEMDSSHVGLSEGGQLFLRFRGAALPLAWGEPGMTSELAASLAEKELFIFGLGAGDVLAAVLPRCPASVVTAWERDPWLLRLALSRHDVAAEILSGRLRLCLGVDLIRYCPPAQSRNILWHPALADVYTRERRLLIHGLGSRRALICEGDLLVDDIADALQMEGFTLYTLDSGVLSPAEMGYTVIEFKPEVVVAVNYRQGLADFCQSLGVPLLCWEIDPVIDQIKPYTGPAGQSYIFCYRQSQIEEFRKAGLPNVEYLPLAANTHRLHPVEPATGDVERYGAKVSFVGASLGEEAQRCRNLLLARYRVFRDNAPEALAEGSCQLESILREQRRDFSRNRIPELMRRHFAPWLTSGVGLEDGLNVLALAGAVAAAEKRRVFLEALNPFGVQVWGDALWQESASTGVSYRGPADHFSEVPKVYRHSQINLDLNRLYQPDMITLRVFDTLACGGFVLTEDSPVLRELFSPGREVAVYRTLEELIQQVTYFLAHPEEAQAIARRGLASVRQSHTVEARVRHMLTRLPPPAQGVGS